MRIKRELMLNDGRKLLVWFANNAGRGTDNCTLIVVDATTPRATMSADQTGVIAKTRTGAWSGDINLSKAVQAVLGISLNSRVALSDKPNMIDCGETSED